MPKTPRVLAITLDLDDTLWPVRPTLEQASAALCAWLDRHAPGAAALMRDRGYVAAARRAIAQQRPGIMHDVSAVMRQVIAAALLHGHADAALVEPAFALYYAQRQHVTLYDDALPTLTYLARHYPLVALTNGNADIHAIGLAPYFKASFNAADVGAGKPDPAMFRAAITALGVAPEQVLHVGDDPHMDGLGALQSGLQAAWINRGQLRWPFPSGPRPQLIARDLQELRQQLQAPARSWRS